MICAIIGVAAAAVAASLAYTIGAISTNRPALDGQADDVEIIISAAGDRVWVNINALAAARWYRVGHVYLDDRRRPP
jgi:hypothetical protein